jgi:hypothetical protein
MDFFLCVWTADSNAWAQLVIWMDKRMDVISVTSTCLHQARERIGRQLAAAAGRQVPVDGSGVGFM